MAITLDGSLGITTPTYGGADTSEYLVPVTQFKNRLINGNMSIDQRNAGASVTPTANPTYTLDRWLFALQQASKMSIQQSTTAPTGFINSLLATSLSAYTPLSSDYHAISQRIEGLNMFDFAWGTADAKTVTLSFWVRSSLTGTFSGAIVNSAADRSYPFTYTISSANTFEYKTVTIAGDTSGTWLTTNGIGARLFFSLGTGSTYLGTAGAWAGAFYVGATGSVQPTATNGATFYLTGVQLEVGSTATSFDYRPYGTELALCQRYYFRLTNDSGGTVTLTTMQAYSASAAFGKLCDLPVQMRATPTGSLSAIGSFNPSNTAGAGLAAFSSGTIDAVTKNSLSTGGFGGSSGLAAGNCTGISMANNAWIAASAEL